VTNARLALTFGAIALGVACNAVLAIPGGVTETTGDGAALPDAMPDASNDDSAPTCPLDAAMGNLCHECRDEYCCAAFVACSNSTACQSYIDCDAPCTTDACKLACIRQNDAGHAIAAPYIACGQLHCPGPCGTPDAGACLDCQEANCEMEIYGCFSDPDCDELFTCLAACGAGKDACLQGCKNEASSATQELYNDYFACGVTYCTTACE
jgi:hypothetical protein